MHDPTDNGSLQPPGDAGLAGNSSNRNPKRTRIYPTLLGLLPLSLLLLFAACPPGSAGTDSGNTPGPTPSETADPTWDGVIEPGTEWQWQLQGTIDTSIDVPYYDIDLFDSPQATIDQLCESIGVFYERVYYYNGRQLVFDASEGVPPGLENSYLINHSASIFLVNPAGKLHAIFTSPHDPATITRDLAAIQAGWRS